MRNRMTLQNFARSVGFKKANITGFKKSLQYLEESGALKVKQGGFIAHSMCHPRIVYVYDWKKVTAHFGQIKPRLRSKPEHYYDEADRSEESVVYSLVFCVSDKLCKRQIKRECLPYPLCLELRTCKHQIGAKLKKERVKILLEEIYQPDARALFFNC